MNKSYATIHCVQILIGIIFGLFVAYVSYANSIEGRPDLTPIRAALSVVLILYSAIQIWVLKKNQISKIQIYSFPIICITFSMFWEYAARGYIKDWSPATHAEATYQNVVCMLILSFIVFMALFTTFKRQVNV